MAMHGDGTEGQSRQLQPLSGRKTKCQQCQHLSTAAMLRFSLNDKKTHTQKNI